MSETFSEQLLAWFDEHGRHDLPWQHPRTPYRVWLAEIMLQQTQVATVIPYYQRFLEHFPDLPSLAEAPTDSVLAQWAGLGYYSRARNLHRAAQICSSEHAGTLPADQEQLEALPGIGRSTAAAIRAQAYAQRAAILDGNVKRVLARYHGIDQWPGLSKVHQALWVVAEKHTPYERITDYTQAIMDLGASVCRRSRPTCELCPLSKGCRARIESKQAEWPARAPRKVRPIRHAVLLWAIDSSGRSLFQRRPPTGIWGGLWSLPEIPADSAAQAEAVDARPWCEKSGLRINQIEPLTSFHHDFSHYRVHLYPLRLQVEDIGSLADSDSRWCDATELAKIGLPAPIQKLIAQR